MSATAQPQSDRIFAYLVLVCPPLGPAEIEQRSYRDILAAFLAGEEGRASESEMWPFGWGARMRRLAPVQFAGAADLRAAVQKLFGSPVFRFDHPAVFGGSVLYYARPPLLPAAAPAESKDVARLTGILSASAELAAHREYGVLFAGGWIWDCPGELSAERQVSLMAAGMPYVDRRVP